MGYLDSNGLGKQVECIKRYVQAKLAEYLPKSGGTIDGNLTVSGTITGDVTGDVTGTASGNLPLSGGTMTGNIVGGHLFSIYNSSDDDSTRVFGASAWDKGAGLNLWGKDYTGSKGFFTLYAHDGTNLKQLTGKPDGTLTWDGKNIARDVKSGTTNGTISVNGSDVSVYGLGSAAYTDSTAYATSSHTHSYLATTGGTVSGTLTLSRTTDAGATSTTMPALVVGGTSAQKHIAIDNDEIMAVAANNAVGTLYINNDGGAVYVGSGTVGVYLDNSAAFRPRTTKKLTLGASSYLWTTVYANSSTISTSDKRQKDLIGDIPDAILDAWGDLDWQQFKMKDSIAEKGIENARLHTGLIAQDVKQVFEDAGLDPTKYGFFCFDRWEAEPAVISDSGRVMKEATEAGESYAVRYEEALVIEAAYQRRRADRLEARISELEERMTALEK